jgi:hypothetical protein
MLSFNGRFCKNLILDKYPDSEYARIITNPNYFKDAIRRTAIAQVFYENTYRAYVNRQYNDVIQRKAEADSMFAPSNLSPKFSFLKSMAVGKTQPLPTFVASLNQFILDYPKDSLNALAKDILDKINHRSAPAPNDSLFLITTHFITAQQI